MTRTCIMFLSTLMILSGCGDDSGGGETNNNTNETDGGSSTFWRVCYRDADGHERVASCMATFWRVVVREDNDHEE